VAITATQQSSLPVRSADLVKLAWPVGMENLLNMSLMWVDSIIINHKLGTESFAAVQMGGQLMNIITLVLSVVAAGASIVISHQVGAEERLEAADTANQSIGAGLLVSIGLGVLIWAGSPTLLHWLGARGGVHTQGVVFMQMLAAFMPAVGMLAILGAVLRATGDTRGPMMVTLLVNILNAALNYLFVWGIPAFTVAGIDLPALGGGMGLQGSALGTSLARVMGALLMLALLLRRTELPVKMKRFFRFSSDTLMRVARLGVPGAMEWVSWQGSQLVLTALIAPLGTTVIAARGIGGQAESFSYLPAQALSVAGSILVGQMMGARRRDDAVFLARKALVYGGVGMGGLGVVLFLFPRQIAGVFTSDPDVLRITAVTIRIAAAYKVGQCVNIICGGIFRGAGNPQWPTLLTTLGTWLVTVPVAFVAVRLGYGLPGVLSAMFIDEMVRGAINVWYFTTPRWRFRHV
jgi:putative MATE family efflux protein